MMLRPKFVLLSLVLFFLGSGLTHATGGPADPQRIQAHAIAFAAVLSTTNGSPLTELGTGANQQEGSRLLAEWWGADSRAGLLKLLEGIELGWNGHRAALHEIVERYREVPVENLFNTLMRESKSRDAMEKNFVAATYLRAPEGRVLRFTAWDFGRYISLCRWGFDAGYLTETEAWDRILPVARMLQASYGSWREFAGDYVQGREFYSPAQMRENGPAVRGAVTQLLEPPNGLWARIPWEESLGDGPVAVDRFAVDLKKEPTVNK